MHSQLLAFTTQILTRQFAPLINKPITILDVGCGTGLMSHYMANAFFNASVTGIDVNQQDIESAQKEFSNATFTLIEENRPLPFADNSFDLIYCSFVLHHIQQQSLSFFIKELTRVLKPEGNLIIFELNPNNINTRRQFKKDHEKSYILSPAFLKKVFHPHGTVSVNYLYLLLEKYRWLKFLEPFLKALPFGSLYQITFIKKV